MLHRLTRWVCLCEAGVIATMVLSAGPAFSQAVRDPPLSSASVQVLQLRPDFYMLTVADVNVGLQIGPDGAVVVDAGPRGATEALLETIKQLSQQPIRFVVNTSADAERVGGNAKLAAAGVSVMTPLDPFSQLKPDDPTDSTKRAPIIARENVLEQLVADSAAGWTSDDFPTATFSRPQYNFRLNGDVINVISMPPAHSAADSVVLFRRADVIVTGAIFDVTRFPVLDLAHGGSIDGEIAAINQVMNTLAVPSGPFVDDSNNGTLIIPARGPVCTQPELLTYRDMLYTVRERVQSLINQGAGLKQVEAANPAQGYERRFGSADGALNGREFVRVVYQSLKMKPLNKGRSQERQ